jgi:predicted PhzF superfamily epimerase YddE/YHI9
LSFLQLNLQKLSDAIYQKIGAEFNLSETSEVPLCGHATMATSHVLLNEIGTGLVPVPLSNSMT